MNDPSIDNPRLLTAEGEAEHIAIEQRHAALVAAGLTYAGCSRLHADGTPREQRLDFDAIEARIAAHYAGRCAGYRIVAAQDALDV